MILYDGGRYEGEWKDDKCHGNGTFIYPDGSRYEREHKDDNYDGQGTLTLSTGNKYEGEWKDNIKVGAFIITSSDGTRKTGEYIEGKLQGEPQVIEKIEETGTYDGWVYISINPSLQKNYLKIGYTRRTPEVRARELSEDTGTPTEFLVAYKRQVYDCEKVESLVHKALHRYRITVSSRQSAGRDPTGRQVQDLLAPCVYCFSIYGRSIPQKRIAQFVEPAAELHSGKQNTWKCSGWRQQG